MLRSSKSRFIIVLALVVALILVCAVPTFIWISNGHYRVEGAGMEPNLHSDQFVLVDYSAYRSKLPMRGDVVMLRKPSNPTRLIVERVIGLPGETVEIHKSQVLINNQPLALTFGELPASYDFGQAVVGTNQYFVLGDNRGGSSDSHSFGAVPFANILGKAWFSYWPLAYWGFVK